MKFPSHKESLNIVDRFVSNVIFSVYIFIYNKKMNLTEVKLWVFTIVGSISFVLGFYMMIMFLFAKKKTCDIEKINNKKQMLK